MMADARRQHGTLAMRRSQLAVLGIAIALTAALCAAAYAAGPSRHAVAALIGVAGGLALYHAGFGFTSAWRAFTLERRGRRVRAQLLLIALTAAISFPLIAYGRDVGLPAGGFVFPFGVAAAIGAFLFGIGMQLGGGCGSGTLYTAGGGSSRMMVTLAAFITGSLIATAHLPAWRTLPALPATSLIREFGAIGALVLTGAVLAAMWLATVTLERKRHGRLESVPAHAGDQRRAWLTGPWPLAAGAVALAGVGIATLLVLGRPWGITSGFALWGAKIANGVGIPVTDWPYWSGQAGAIERSVFADATSVMNFGLMLGAMAAAALAGRFAPKFRLTMVEVVTAIIGGLAMGYGARLAYGCNIGAYLGGVISGSLHGWGWLVFGLAGSVVGTRLRRIAGMDRPPDATDRGLITAN